ncbi:tRNA 2-thiouridine(34) synthase MnmA [Candidatus Parcubacteria bacterium]|uniref:tRNA-specific 2-thiouridylase MnmA n=1 Tax=Candidatus Kaiserbacteria bacterium CG10_big_fil_rev_8_21_14_0_10_47_16 TaxID=1974608 RepID=A0A2H0UDL0_9BACT|nr:tRNA 2-thiouridine(34) synthase MnmA [Candidatus Parcubacteria bacterium]PIR84440.1 MAG: tRNA 2-thiouridine(34) synthase MnmA [Candidatus Kaiserbacteria bacterium CG10_big_fil_rev_8_21_14_0_10_47_16]
MAKVFVGLSGGVDSSVAALRLLHAGHEVVGVFIKTWQPDFISCNWEAERLDAMRVAAHLGIPFLTFDAEEAYKKGVADYMIAEYEAGRTPNPDVMCNKEVKFGAFLTFAKAEGANFVATGHYAQNSTDEHGRHLLRGNDSEKDQSYFLWTLTNDQLNHILFPVGDSPKSVIRDEALRARLPTATKHDSQGICFLGQVDMKDFLSHYITTEAGDVLNESGECIGTHDGALYYTLGQRHGFTVTVRGRDEMPHYVIGKDLKKNTITVGNMPQRGQTKTLSLTDMNILTPLTIGETYEAQIRYRQTPFPVRFMAGEGSHGTLEVLVDIETPSPGQSCVLYVGTECLGGGIITE